MFGAQTDEGAIVQPGATALGLFCRHLQALSSPDELHVLGVDSLAGHLQEAADGLVDVTAEPGSQANHARRQGVLVVSHRLSVTLGGTRLAQHFAGTPFRDRKPLTDCRHASAAA